MAHFWDGAREESLEILVKQRRYQELLHTVLGRLEAARDLSALFQDWHFFLTTLPVLPESEVVLTLASEQALHPGPRPALDLLRARLQLHPVWKTLHDQARARSTLGALGESGEGTVQMLARYELGMHLATQSPGEAITWLRALAGSKQDLGPFGALASLALGRAYLRSDQPQVALAHYQSALRRYRKLRLEPEGDLAAYFLHGISESLEALGRHSAAQAEYQRLYDRFPDYPARSEVQSLLAGSREER